MANKNFVVKNGLTVGNLTIDADSGNIITTGNLVTSGIRTDAYFYANGAPFANTGYVGSAGPAGYTGSKGDTGSQGTTGYTGSKGSDGIIGVDGYTGSVGYTGSKGDTGLGFTIAKTYASVAALTADTSPTGIVAGQFAIIDTGNVNDAENSRLYIWNGSIYQYVNDLSGAIGLTGPQGIIGYTGSAGSAGSQGAAGYTGSAGTTGYTGSIGTSGYTGSTGNNGYTGSIGYVGSSGVASAWVIKTSNYTASPGDRIIANTSGGLFTITLPATPGTGSSITITDGNNFSITSLIINRNGSTIEGIADDVELDVGAITVEFFFDGTTWQMISTFGPTGYTGSIGYVGSTGTNGINGYNGSIGYTGSIGANGYTGSIGSLGYTGSRGTDGYTGSRGTDGYTGSTGSQGTSGYTGSRGTDGTIGYNGSTGYTGSIGYSGSAGLADWYKITGNYTAVDRQRIMLDSSGGQFTLTLPLSPSLGTYIQLTDAASLSANPVTVNRNGSTIEGLTGNLILDVSNATFEFIYDGATWQVTSTSGPKGDVGYTGSSVAGYAGSTGYTGSQGDTGLGFVIAKTYLSVAALTADTSPTGIVAGQFALIETGNVNDADNSKLYLWNGSNYSYVNDLSGAAGITGPQGSIGYTGSASNVIGYTGSAGTNGTVGYNGSTGYTGSKGTDGVIGVDGYTGSVGYTGSKGTDGVIGYTGSVGAGYTGSSGYTGSGGLGYTGSIGPQGNPGIATSSLLADTFTGNGSQTSFTLSVTPTGINQTIVNIDGVSQIRNTYSLSGNILTFSEAPANGAEIEVTIFVYGTANFVNRSYTGNGSATTFTVTSGVTNDSILVTDNGVVQRPIVDYSVSDTTIIFVTAPSNGANIQIREIPVGTVGYTGSASSVVGYTGSAGTNGYTGSIGVGYTGSAGTNGYTGSIGLAGYTGSASTVAGYTGSIGLAGYTGSAGAGTTIEILSPFLLMGA